jgi:ABC-2 type transport system ATP-binding protein
MNELSLKTYWREIRWQVGYMPDFFGVYDNLLVWEYLDFFARCYKMAPERRSRIVQELLELVDLAEKRDAYVQTLSRGMRQRLCLAHALVHDPQVLLLDEPASGLDPRARVEMRELLRELRNLKKTILLSSHILSELAELCDRVAIMERGRLVASGPLDEILRQAYDQRVYTIHVLNDPERAENVLRNSPLVRDAYPAQNNGRSHLIIEFSGDDEAAADLLALLVAEGIRVSNFNEKQTNLEDAFLRLTKGEVA